MHFDSITTCLYRLPSRMLVLLQILQKWGQSDFDQVCMILFTLMSFPPPTPLPSGTPPMLQTIETYQGQESRWLSTQ